MKTRASDLRHIARANQNKHYWWAVLITLVAMLLAGTAYAYGTTQPQLNFNFRFSITPLIRQIEDLCYNQFGLGYIPPELEQVFNIMYAYANVLNFFLTIGSIAALLSLAALFISGPMRYGYSRWCLQMHDAAPRSHFGTLFSGFKHYGAALGLQWWRWLMLFLWSLLSVLLVFIGILIIGLIFGAAFVANPDLAYMDPLAAIGAMIGTIIAFFLLSAVVSIAGCLPTIIAEYRYSMAYYILVENPDMGAIEAVNCSKRLMKGNKWRLFCLHFSFIGWYILDALSFHILGLLFLNPYREMAVAAFYRDLVPAGPESQLWADRPKAPQGYRPAPQGYRPPQGYTAPQGSQPNWQQPQQQPRQNPPAANDWYTPAAPAQQPAAPQAPADPFADLPKAEKIQQPDWGTPPEAPKNPWEQ